MLILPFLLIDCTTDTKPSFSLTWSDTSIAFPYTDEQVQKIVNVDLVLSTNFYNDSLLMAGYWTGYPLRPQYVTSSNAGYEVSTNDSVRAYNSVDSIYRNGDSSYAIQMMGSTEKFFQFSVVLPNRMPLWYRVHKASYLDRSMCINNQDLSKDGPLAQLAVVPVTIDKFVEASRYLYVKCPPVERIILDNSSTNGDTLHYYLYQVYNYVIPNSFLGSDDGYDIFRLSFTANAKIGLITYSRKRIREYETSR